MAKVQTDFVICRHQPIIGAMDLPTDDTSGYTEKVKESEVNVIGFHSENLEQDMESLDLDCDKSGKRSCQSPTANRRYSLRPQRKVVKTSEYAVTPAKKKALRKNGFLETIFESPINKRGGLVFLGSKVPRSISFSDFVSKAKVKQRKLKIKRLNKTKLVIKKSPNNVTIDDVKLKLKCLEASDEDEWVDLPI